MDDIHEKLLPIDQETGEIAYDKIEKSANDILKEIYVEFRGLTWTQIAITAVFIGLLTLLIGGAFIVTFYLLKWLFVVSPFLFMSFAAGFVATFVIAFLSKHLKKRNKND